MKNLQDILRYDERIIFDLRALYSKYGYEDVMLSRFEEYSLYASNRTFLPPGEIIAFAGAGGKLMALRPDVTLSIIKGTDSSAGLRKVCYNENIYRTVDGQLKEQMQVGLECIGSIEAGQSGEVALLAKQSLDILGGGRATRLDISHMGFPGGLLGSEDLTAEQKADIMQCIRGKNVHGLKKLCFDARLSDGLCERLTALISLRGAFKDVKAELSRLCINDETETALRELDELDAVLESRKAADGINIDFSVVNDITYYSGIIFQGFVEGVPERVLSGGRYDELVRSFGKSGGAIGFAAYLDTTSGTSQPTNKMLGIALPKGRLGQQAYELFKKAGFDCPDIDDESRKLVFENPKAGVRYFWVKPSDVAVYVERGIADVGVVGKDTLLENDSDVYELLDLGLGKCRMCSATFGGAVKSGSTAFYGGYGKTLRVATKFPNIARRHYANLGCDIDVIKLNGSIELAPLLGLSDVIVDLVETGNTLKENNLKISEIIMDISARLIANKAACKFKQEEILKLCEKIGKQQQG